MTVADAKAKLDRGSGEPATGYVSVNDFKAAFDDLEDTWEAADGVLTTALAAKVAGPASAVDNAVTRYDGTTGKIVQASTATVDDNGRLTVATGAAGGLAIGGPLHLTGTGSPLGVVSAPPGSTWTDTDVTTGALLWRKVTGTGNTGWRVADGDTGSRNLTPENSWTAGTLILRRSGSTVHVVGSGIAGGAATAQALVTLPTGFRPLAATPAVLTLASSSGWATGTVATSGIVTLVGTSANYTAGRLSATYITPDAWPTTLP